MAAGLTLVRTVEAAWIPPFYQKSVSIPMDTSATAYQVTLVETVKVRPWFCLYNLLTFNSEV